jgi:hypothetical protein
MSRYKQLGGMHFDKKQNSQKATAEQLALLAAVEDISVDDLLDEGLSQGQVMRRLADVLHSNVIPADVYERRRLAKEQAAMQPACRICSTRDEECEGDITRHHFIPRWLMLQLENYTAYAARSKCTIPICIGRHRDLHLSGDPAEKSIAQYLTDDERKFAQKMLDELREQHPFAIMDWVGGGDPKYAYEAQLIQDYREGAFRTTRRDGQAMISSTSAVS